MGVGLTKFGRNLEFSLKRQGEYYMPYATISHGMLNGVEVHNCFKDNKMYFMLQHHIFTAVLLLFFLTRELWDGPSAGLETAKDFFGADEVSKFYEIVINAPQARGGLAKCKVYSLSQVTVEMDHWAACHVFAIPRWSDVNSNKHVFFFFAVSVILAFQNLYPFIYFQ